MHCLLTFILFLGLYFPPLTAQDYVEIEDKATLPILSPAYTERKTLKLKLANGLQAYIVSDPNADQSAAALVVQTGSWNDPAEVHGMAHLVEHMLFLGTKKYPHESEYDRFITENGGLSNAFTEDDDTVYAFSINDNKFEEALDRFASFFKEPLFNPSGLSREIQAVDQEFSKNFENDNARLYFVMKELSNPNHPDSRFSIGSKETLSKLNHAEIRKWYENHYSANIMSLVIYSDLPIEKLKEMVIQKFSSIPNRNKTPFSSNERLTSTELNGHLIYITPLKNIRTLTLVWELPQQLSHLIESKPETIITTILGDEGEKSLLALLKEENLAESLKAGTTKLSRDKAKIYIQLELTVSGLKNLDMVILDIFQAIDNLRKKGAPQYLFDELQHLQKTSYQYPNREKAFKMVMNQAAEIVDEDLSTFPEKSNIVQKFDPQAIQEILNFLTPQNAQFYIMANPTVTKVTPDHIERWMKIPYGIVTIPPKKLDFWANPPANPKLDLPSENRFISKNLSFVNPTTRDAAFPHPKLIVDNEKAKIYYAPDRLYLVPEVYYGFEIKTPQVDIGDPTQIVLADIYIKALEARINQLVYPAQIAGLTQEIERTDNYGISITVKGYSEKAPMLLEEIFKNLRDVKPTKEAFSIYKETLKRQYQNASKKLSVELAREVLESVLYKNYVTDAEKAKAIKGITYDTFLDYLNNIYEFTFVEGMVYGNVTEDHVKGLWEKIEPYLPSQVYPKDLQKKQEVIRLPTDQGPFYIDKQTKSQGNAAMLAVENPPFTFKTRAAQQVLSKALEQPFFSALRTKQQTGYLVYNWDEELELELFTLFADQSKSHDVRDLLARFELVLESFVQEITRDLPEERFIAIQQAIVDKLLQPPEDLKTMGDNLFRFAFEYGGDFDWIAKRAQATKDLTHDEAIQFAQEVFGRKNTQRIGVLVRGETDPEDILQYTKVKCLQNLRDMSQYLPRKAKASP